MNRRSFIHTTGISLAALLISDYLFSGTPGSMLINFPDEVTAILDNELVHLTGKGKQYWTYKNLRVELVKKATSIAVEIQSPKSSLSAVTLHWKKTHKPSSVVLNDHWERTYGDVSWHPSQATEILPWYFMEYNDGSTNGFGVKTGGASFCGWQLDNDQLRLSMDTRSGGEGVQLADRKLQAAEIVTIKSLADESAFKTMRRFMGMMCAKARMPQQPVYGINDWYFTYGNNSEKLIVELTEMMAPMAEHLENRPFSVIDAGWFVGTPSSPNDCCWGDRVDTPNAKFGDMSRVAEKIKKTGMRPGIWTRPLCGSYKDPASLMLPLIKGREEKKPVLDPSIPENLERIKKYFKGYNDWGYEMVKFDFTTYDILGKWGFEMMKDNAMSSGGWQMYDSAKTNAEIILQLYTTIREAAGKTYIIGCNTISHLSAGLFELNRIGDDTSGNEWDRTRKMGVNTLAFRGVQHGHFYATDADCVGLTTKIDWQKNKQWMELVAKSGTPLFISAQPEATGTIQKQFIKECFATASKKIPVGEPLDWMQTAFPKKWKLNGETVDFNWD
jgi:alpha-galactosidase